MCNNEGLGQPFMCARCDWLRLVHTRFALIQFVAYIFASITPPFPFLIAFSILMWVSVTETKFNGKLIIFFSLLFVIIKLLNYFNFTITDFFYILYFFSIDEENLRIWRFREFRKIGSEESKYVLIQ